MRFLLVIIFCIIILMIKIMTGTGSMSSLYSKVQTYKSPEKELVRIFIKILECCLTRNSWHIIVVVPVPTVISNMLLYHIHYAQNTPVVILKGNQHRLVNNFSSSTLSLTPTYLRYPKAFIIILNKSTPSTFYAVASKLVKLVYWNSRARILLIFTEPIESSVSEVVEEIFVKCWKENIVNIVILLQEKYDLNSTRIRVLTYDSLKLPSNLDVTEEIFNGDMNFAYQDKLRNLHKSTIRSSMFLHYPNSMPLINNGDKIYFGGPDGNLITTFIKHLNASLETVSPMRDVDYGFKSFNGTITGSAGDIVYNRADIASNSRKIDINLLDVIEFSYPHSTDEIYFVVAKSQLIPPYMKFLLPYPKTVWYLIICTLLMATPIWYYIRNYSQGTTLISAFLQIYRVFLSISLAYSPKIIKERLFFIMWTVFGLIVTSAYQGCLISFLTIPIYFPDIETLQELDQSGYEIFMNPGADSWPTVEDPKDVLFKLSKKFIKETQNLQSLLKVISTRNKAILMDKQQADYLINLRKFSRDGHPLLNKVEECVYSNLVSYGVKKNSLYLVKFEEVIRRVMEGGFFQKWTQDTKRLKILDGTLSDNQESSVKKEPLSLSQLQTPFFILIFGLIVSAFYLCIELCC
ncbi:Ionotropic receptor 874 [Blattella germanica]|nr:Ionotropic receptor 874 [Blattella germanica]